MYTRVLRKIVALIEKRGGHCSGGDPKPSGGHCY